MPTPTMDQRLAARAANIDSPVMYQRWSRLLFLHWKWDAADLQKRLPAGLTIDTFQDTAWLGIVPFFMERIRPRFLVPLPKLSWFQELNVRTYVHDENGTPGVWFFSLDCNQPIAVWAARQFFGLPYFNAKMDDEKAYTCQRRGQKEASIFEYELNSATQLAEPGSLDFFLAERYILFANTPRGLRLGRVQHSPYPLCTANVTQWDQKPLEWNAFQPTATPPHHVIGCAGVDVRIGALQKLRQA